MVMASQPYARYVYPARCRCSPFPSRALRRDSRSANAGSISLCCIASNVYFMPASGLSQGLLRSRPSARDGRAKAFLCATSLSVSECVRTTMCAGEGTSADAGSSCLRIPLASIRSLETDCQCLQTVTDLRHVFSRLGIRISSRGGRSRRRSALALRLSGIRCELHCDNEIKTAILRGRDHSRVR